MFSKNGEMEDLPKVLNLFGLALGILGAYRLYKVPFTLWKVNDDSDITPVSPEDSKAQEKASKTGFLLVFLGFILQAISTITPSFLKLLAK